MRLFVDFDIKEFDDEKAEKALAFCENLCKGCDSTLNKCLVGTGDCPVKNAVEALSGMIRTGRGVTRYKGLGNL